MISTESLSQEWLESVSKKLGYPDKGLLEKAIRALSLLELLVKAGCPLCFKGGSSLLLLLRNTIHRISIDVDIICPPGTDINVYLEGIRDYGFTRAVRTGREHPGGTIPVSHSKVFYEIAYNPMHSEAEGYIRLDVLYEDIQYSRVEMVPIEHPVLKTKGEPVMVKVPTKEDILGDKLTAFGPNSIGIPYEKNGRNCSLEIVKQIFDIGRLFDNVQDFSPAFESFRRVSVLELSYRGLSRIKSFMFRCTYLIESAITDSAKAAYLATCFQCNNINIEKYTGPESITKEMNITPPLHSKLSKLKSSNPEAYFYWAKTNDLISKSI